MLIKPEGKMTKPIESKYEVGTFVRRLFDDEAGAALLPETFARRGDIGIIRRIYPGCPDDGDGTWVAYDVYFADAGVVDDVEESGIVRASKSQYVAKLVRPIVRELKRRAEDLAAIGLSGRALEGACARIAKAS